MSNQKNKCPNCGSTDIGLRWGKLNFVHKCRECDHEF